MRGLDEHTRVRKETNMFNSVNQQTPKMNKKQGKEQIVLESNKKKL
jgi:hypothetical protein